MSYPPPLLAAVLADSEPVAVLTKKVYASRLAGNVAKEHVVLLEGDWAKEMEAANRRAEPVGGAVVTSLDDMAYTVYSSGTTGKPKGQ